MTSPPRAGRPAPGAALRKRLRAALAAIPALLMLLLGPAMAETRIALVVGNGGYSSGPLPNAVKDARLIASALSAAGFRTETALDVDHRDFKRAVRRFADQLRAAGPDAVAAFYYAGHGVQVNGRNFLIPVNTPLRSASDVEYETVDAQWILDMIGESGAPLSIIMLDACRNNPFPSVSRSAGKGLARMDAPRGAILSYATAPGAVAYDGKHGNSPYARALSQTIARPGLKVEDTFKSVRRSVLAETDGRQTPWESSSLLGDFYFSGGAGQGAPAPAPAPVSTAPAPPPASSGGGFQDCPDCPRMLRISGGSFGLGSPASEPGREGHEGPETQVTLRPFALARTEVTIGDWKRYERATGRKAKRGCWHWWGVWLWDGNRSFDNHDWPVDDSHPVTCISFPEAQAYAAWISDKAGRAYRLPSEAEFEWAAGADAGAPWGASRPAGACAWGNLHDRASVARWGGALPSFACDDGWAGTAPVGTFRPNPMGLSDMLGNAWEWTADCWNPGHGANARRGAPVTRGDCSRRVQKGGHFATPRGWMRPAYRYGAQAKAGNIYAGFRLARDL